MCRGNSRDYDSWSEAGNPGWSAQEVEQYFTKSAATNSQGTGRYTETSVADPYHLIRIRIQDLKQLCYGSVSWQKGSRKMLIFDF